MRKLLQSHINSIIYISAEIGKDGTTKIIQIATYLKVTLHLTLKELFLNCIATKTIYVLNNTF